MMLPSTMKAAQGSGYGDPNDVLTVQDNVPLLSLKEAVPNPKQRRSRMIIRTLSVALAPGDCRVMSGKTREFQGPPSFPYIPAGDCSGIIVELPEDYDDGYFQVGDYVAARFDAVPRGALAEYAVISMNVCDKVGQPSMSPDEAATLASASPATVLADRCTGKRVLVLGANGGQGSHFCQLARRNGAAYIVGVSEDPERLLKAPIACDKAIDYTQHDVWTLPEFQKNPFDTVVDLACGGWLKLQRSGASTIVKPAVDGGRYLTMCPDEPIFEAHSLWSILSIFLFPPLWRAFKSRVWTTRTLPKYTYVMGLTSTRDVMTKTLGLASEGKLQAVMDTKGPFPFTTQGVRAAFERQASRHAKGKVVIQVGKKD